MEREQNRARDWSKRLNRDARGEAQHQCQRRVCVVQGQDKADKRKHGLQGNPRKPYELWWRIERMMEED